MLLLSLVVAQSAAPNIVLVVADDLGYAETGYAPRPAVQTPAIDALAASGLVLDRFYAAAPSCSPSRAGLLTGRAPKRTGVPAHGHALRPEERTLAAVLGDAGYATGHFGKWHLSGIVGMGVPLLAQDPLTPAVFGFERWTSVTNYVDEDPLVSRDGVLVELEGDSSEAFVEEAIRFMDASLDDERPFLAVVWLTSPHNPWQSRYAHGSDIPQLAARLGEIVGIDHSMARLDAYLAERGIADDTLVWFQSDNGPRDRWGDAYAPMGELRGGKATLYEGGLRVPSFVRWPSHVQAGRTSAPVSGLDVLPTLAATLGILLPEDRPMDGRDVSSVLFERATAAGAPIRFEYHGARAAIHGDLKIVQAGPDAPVELYDVAADPGELDDLAAKQPEQRDRMLAELDTWSASVERSGGGADYDASFLDLTVTTDRAPVYASMVHRYGQIAQQAKPRVEGWSWKRVTLAGVLLLAFALGVGVLIGRSFRR